MTDEQMKHIISHLERWAPYNEFQRQTLEIIRELQDRLAAERQAHEATIKHCDEMLNRVGMS